MFNLISTLINPNKRRGLIAGIILVISVIIILILILVFTTSNVEAAAADDILEYQVFTPPYATSRAVDFTQVAHDNFDNTEYVPGTKDTVVTSSKGMMRVFKGANYIECYKDLIPKVYEVYYDMEGRILPSVLFAQWVQEIGWIPSYKASATYNVANFQYGGETNGKGFSKFKSWSDGKFALEDMYNKYDIIQNNGTFSNVSPQSQLAVNKDKDGYEVCCWTRDEHVVVMNTSLGYKTHQNWCASSTQQAYNSGLLEKISSNNLEWLDDQAKAGVKGDAVLAAILTEANGGVK